MSVFLEFQEAFNLFDNRGDGKIQQQQIGECLRALGQNPTESDVKKFTHQLKPDERISFEVFLPIYQVRSFSGCSLQQLTFTVIFEIFLDKLIF